MREITYLGLLSRVILYPAFLLQIFFEDTFASINLAQRKGECALALSSRVDKAIETAALTRLNARFHDSCFLATESMDDFFTDAAVNEWKELGKSTTFGFWIDLSIDGSEVIVRAVDLASQLQWGQAKISVVSLSDRALGNLLGEKIDRLVDDYFFVGFVENNEFFSWTKNSRLKVYGVHRNEVRHHPFLPKLIDIRSKEIPAMSGLISTDEGRKKWELAFDKEVKLPTDRVWLKSGISTE